MNTSNYNFWIKFYCEIVLIVSITFEILFQEEAVLDDFISILQRRRF